MLSPISDKSMSLFFELPEVNNQDKSGSTYINDGYSSIQSNKPVGDYLTSVVDQVTPFLNFDSFPPLSPASSGSDSGISSDIQSQQVDFDLSDLIDDWDDGLHKRVDQLDIDLSDPHTIQQALDKMVRDQSLPKSVKSMFYDLLMFLKDNQETSPLSAVSSDCDSGGQNPDDFDLADLIDDWDDGFHEIAEQLDIALLNPHTIQQDLDKMVSDLDGMQEYKSTENLTNIFSDVNWFDEILGLPGADQNDRIQVDRSCHREDSKVADGYLSNRPSQSMSRNLLPHDHAYSGLNPGRSNSAVTKESEQEKEENSGVSGIKIDGEYFSRQQIAEMKVKDFNALINGQSSKTVLGANYIRRTEKNKDAARRCRKRKVDERAGLENEVQLMRDKAKKMRSENDKISTQINVINKICADLEDTLGVKACKQDGKYIIVPRK